MQLDDEVCFHASRARDARFDGRFFTAIATTGIYCRPICPAKTAKRENMRFYPSAAAAEAAGFRACLRCRPEVSPWTAAWIGTSATVSRALRLIGEGALDEGTVEELAVRLGIGSRQLRRLFLEHLGATPVAVAQVRRAHFARTLLDSGLPITDVAFGSGFSSVRRFNAVMRRTFGRAPGELRRGAPHAAGADVTTLRISVRPPYDDDAICAFLGYRAIPGVESADQDYRRTVAAGGASGILRIRFEPSAILVDVPVALAKSVAPIASRVRRLFDAGADTDIISSHLARDPLLRPIVRRHPGIRVPGCWDPFELAVRAVVGQQVSVKGATTIMGRIAERFGERVSVLKTGDAAARPAAAPAPHPRPLASDNHSSMTPEAAAGRGELEMIFPAVERLADADLRGLGMPNRRADAIRTLARAFADGTVNVNDPDRAMEALLELPGIGPWTAQYIAMRALQDPDAFPHGDLGLRQAAGNGSAVRDRDLLARAESWRPWRAYAAMLLWQSLSDAERMR